MMATSARVLSHHTSLRLVAKQPIPYATPPLSRQPPPSLSLAASRLTSVNARVFGLQDWVGLRLISGVSNVSLRGARGYLQRQVHSLLTFAGVKHLESEANGPLELSVSSQSARPQLH